MEERDTTGSRLGMWMFLYSEIMLFAGLFVLYAGWDSYVDLRAVPRNALDIKVQAEMFQWTFTYPNGKQSTTELVVPFNQPVKLDISSKDVIHSLFIPAYRIKMDAVRGLKTYTWFLPSHLGTYNILCAEYCGVGHAEMRADLKVVQPAEYEAWLAREEEKPKAAAKGEVSPEVLKLFDLSQFHSIPDKITFFWRVDGPLLHVKLKAHALGWVAVGFNPTRGMQGANFIMAYVQNGEVYAADHFGSSPIRHEPDEKLGGESNLTNVFGSESNGVTEVGFSIPLDSGDAKDNMIVPDGETTILLAYNAGMDDFRSKHNYRAAYKVNLATGEFAPLKR